MPKRRWAGSRERVPVVVQRRVDVDARCAWLVVPVSSVHDRRPSRGPRPPDPGRSTAPRGAPSGSTSTGASTSSWVQVAGRPVNVIDIGEGRPRSCSSTGWRAPGQTGWRTSRTSPRDHRVIAMDLPGFGALADARREDLDLRLRAGSSTSCSTRSGIERAAVVGNSMGGFIGAEIAIAVRHAGREARARQRRRAARSSTSATSRCCARCDAARRRPDARHAAGSRRAPPACARGPRCAAALMRLVARHPDRLPAPLIAEQVHGLRQARVRRRAGCADRLPDPRPPERDRSARRSSSGARRTASCRSATPTCSAS